MASIPTVTSIIASATTSYTPLQVAQSAVGSALAADAPQADEGNIVVDIYEGNTAANQAALESYVTGRFYEPPTSQQPPTTGPLNITVATIASAGETETAGEFFVPLDGGNESSLWSYTSADAFDPSLGDATPAYTITLTPDGQNAESATITAADGTSTTTVIGTSSSTGSTPATTASSASTQITDGGDTVALTFDAGGDANVAFTDTSQPGRATTLDASVAYGATLAVNAESAPAALTSSSAIVPVTSPQTPVRVATTAATDDDASTGPTEELSFDYDHYFGYDTDDGVITGVSQGSSEDVSIADLASGTSEQQQQQQTDSSSTPASGAFVLLAAAEATAPGVTATAATAVQRFDVERVTFLTPYSAPSASTIRYFGYEHGSYGSSLVVTPGSTVNATG